LLAGFAIVGLVYPYLAEGFTDLHRSQEAKLRNLQAGTDRPA
jgi:hypothetical protein